VYAVVPRDGGRIPRVSIDPRPDNVHVIAIFFPVQDHDARLAMQAEFFFKQVHGLPHLSVS
jgi:hypothetical protein